MSSGLENVDSAGVRVSVVIPCYNNADRLGRAIESVLGQTRPAEEIVVVDDGSTDGSGEVAGRFSGRVRCVRQDNGGASAARNRGLRETGGEWVAFLDADDRWTPDKLDLMVAAVEAYPGIDALITDTLLMSPAGEVLRANSQMRWRGIQTVTWQRLADPDVWIARRRLAEAMIRDFLGAPTSVGMVRRTVLTAMGGLREDLPTCEDLALCLKLAKGKAVFAYLPKPLTLVELRPRSLCRDNPDTIGHQLGVLEEFERTYRLNWRERSALRGTKAHCEATLAWLAFEQKRFGSSRRHAWRAVRNGMVGHGVRMWFRALPCLRRL